MVSSERATSLIAETPKTSISWLLYLGTTAAVYVMASTDSAAATYAAEYPLLLHKHHLQNPPQKHMHIACILYPWQHKTPIFEV